MNDSKRLRPLDGVRGFAILSVVLYHATVFGAKNTHETWFASFMSLGRFGVDLFFVLSGFLITSILLSARGNDGYYRNFYMRRLLRIVPLYYLLIFFSFVAFPKLAALVPHGVEKLSRFATVSDSWIWYPTFCTNFLVAIRNIWSHGILDVSWSLCIEEHFYLVWPLIVAWLDRRILRWLLIAVIVASPLVRAVMLSAGFSSLQVYVLTFSRLDGIALGCLLALMWLDALDGAKVRAIASWVLAIATSAIAALFAMGVGGDEAPSMVVLGHTLLGLVFAAIMAKVLWPSNGSLLTRFFEQRWLAVLGKYSYAIYLFHLPIRAAIRDLVFSEPQFRALAPVVYVGQFLFYLATLGVSLLFAWLSWNLVEKRFLALKDRFALAGPSAGAGWLKRGSMEGQQQPQLANLSES